jgi:hypothetical protein
MINANFGNVALCAAILVGVYDKVIAIVTSCQWVKKNVERILHC